MKGAPGDETIALEVLEDLFSKHAIVLDGHLGQHWWPRQWVASQTTAPSRLCTCHAFLMHAQCEHCVYVQALNKELQLDSIP